MGSQHQVAISEFSIVASLENNPEYVILDVGTNELIPELTPERRERNQPSMSVKIFKPIIELSVYPV